MTLKFHITRLQRGRLKNSFFHLEELPHLKNSIFLAICNSKNRRTKMKRKKNLTLELKRISK
jgi:hypothetical protein